MRIRACGLFLFPPRLQGNEQDGLSMKIEKSMVLAWGMNIDAWMLQVREGLDADCPLSFSVPGSEAGLPVPFFLAVFSTDSSWFRRGSRY